MSTSVTANRIYARGKILPEDLQEMAPDTLLVKPLRKPTRTDGGLLLPGAGAVGDINDTEKDQPTRTVVVFEVVKLPAVDLQSKGNPLGLKPGDVVLGRNVLIDPLFGDELGTTDLYLGVLGVVERGPEVRDA